MLKGPEDDEGIPLIDELQFEKLGTIAQPRPSIFDGADVPIQTFAGVITPVASLKQTFNLGDTRTKPFLSLQVISIYFF